MTRDHLYTHAQLHRLIAPRSVAIVGVSTNTNAFGSRVMSNLERGGFTGSIYPVNAKYERLGERTCYPSIAALPESPDCVIIAIPREAVEAVVAEAAARKAGGVVILSSGYAETGKPGRLEGQQRIRDIAQAAGMPVIGPNCMGIVNHNIGLLGTFQLVASVGPPPSPLPPATLGIVSQSGALAFALGQATAHGTTFSHVLTSGNACDVDLADQIAYLAEEPSCRAMACVFEGMRDPRRLEEAARRVHAAGKVLVVYKTGVSERGRIAAKVHTASDTGAVEEYRALFRRAGIVEVDNYEALLETAAFFAKVGRPKAPGVAVVATSGGAGIMAADKAEKFGVPMPQPTAETRKVLEGVIPEYGSAANPCDVTAQVLASPDALYASLDAFMAQEDIGAMIAPHVFAYQTGTDRFKVYSEAAARYGKIACIVWLPEYLEEKGAPVAEHDPHLALFRSMERCFAALAAWNQLEQWRREQER